MKKQKGVSYAKWGYVFILPFFISFFIEIVIKKYDPIFQNFKNKIVRDALLVYALIWMLINIRA